MVSTLILIVLAYVAPPRCPDELLASDLSDRNVRVWLAVRKVQGNNGLAWGRAEHYAEVAGKTKSATENALSQLTRDGWLETIGKRGNVPERRCLIPESAAVHQAAGVSRSVRESLTVGEAPGGQSLTEREGQVSRSVRESLTVGEGSPIEGFESSQGIRSGNPSSEQQQQTGAQAREESNADAPPPARVERLTPEQSEYRRRLLALEVFDKPAARISHMEPEWVELVIGAGEWLQRRGQTTALGALVVQMADGVEPLPALDAEAPPRRPREAPHQTLARAVSSLSPELVERFNDLENTPGGWRQDAELVAAVDAAVSARLLSDSRQLDQRQLSANAGGEVQR